MNHKRSISFGQIPILLQNPCVACIFIAVLFILFPWFVSPYLQGIMTKALIFSIFAMSLNLLCGYTGLFSLGHAAYFGLAAYTTCCMIVHLHIESFWLVAPAGIVMAASAAAIFGVFVLRLSGIYFLLITLALGQLLNSVAIKWKRITGGTTGLIFAGYPDLGLRWLPMNDTSFYYLVLIILIVCVFLLNRIVNSPFGLALQAIRGSETRLRSLGYNTWSCKYVAFILAGAFAGVAGTLYKYYSPVLVPSDLGIQASTLALLMVIVGGDRIFYGPILGAIAITFVAHYSSIYTPERWPVILGLLFIVTVMFFRGGVGAHLARGYKNWRAVRGSTDN